ncbi:unnamed protein product, partial [Rotaria sp. Silwood1]
MNDIAATSTGLYPLDHYNYNSLQRSTTDFDEVFMPELQNVFDNPDFECLASLTDPLIDIGDISYVKAELDDCQFEMINIIAQPKAFYRGRYSSEIGAHLAKRFIRAENNDNKHEYPTVQVPTSWYHSNEQLYIRVALVTVPSNRIPYHYIHPYEIDTQEDNVIKDLKNNSLYFPIQENEYIKGEKSFRIIVKRQKLDELKSYGPMRLFDYEQDESLNIEIPQDAKQKLLLYELWKSQLVFTLSKQQDSDSFPVPILHTSAESQIMLNKGSDRRGDSSMNYSNDKSNSAIKCIPQKGDWQGGDEVLIIMSKPIKRKDYTICFDFDLFGTQIINEITHIDTKIILFRTPPCPILPGDENMKVSVVIKKNNIVLSSTEFYYVTPMKATIQLCAQCQSYMNDNRISNKRRYERVEFDSGQSLVSQMQHLSIGE